jgi:hypothetical protein
VFFSPFLVAQRKRTSEDLPVAKSSHISVSRQLCELWNWTNKSLHPYEKELRGMNQKLDSEINSNPMVKIAFLGYLIILISCVKMKKYSLQQG